MKDAYTAAGVDISEAERAVEAMREAVRRTYNPNVLSDVGAFGGLFAAPFQAIKEPVLVSSIDGVGTKTKLAQDLGRYDTIGRDLVHHCVNDILVQGAKPIFFLDYYGVGQLRADVAAEVVRGAAEACRDVGCALIGGETAQMPDIYRGADFDLVGTVVGVAERSKLLPKERIHPRDLLYGLPSTGLHTNGYTLARKALQGLDLSNLRADLDATPAEALLAPHRCYLSELWPLIEEEKILALAHVTGGGIPGNLPRVLPSGLGARIDLAQIRRPPIFDLIRDQGGLSQEEMWHVFNLGVGMIVVSREPIGLPDAVLIGEVTGTPEITPATAT